MGSRGIGHKASLAIRKLKCDFQANTHKKYALNLGMDALVSQFGHGCPRVSLCLAGI